MARIKLTPNFYLDEFTRSATAARHGIEIHVAPESHIYRNLLRLCRHVLEPLRDSLGPVQIISGYRPLKVNRLVGGDPLSRHMQGMAADIVVPNLSPREVCSMIDYKNLPFDQCVLAFGRWAHVDIPPLYARGRRKLLTSYKKAALLPWQRPKTAYINGFHRIENLS